ncbi:hypothetical protein KC19_1G245500 [Ceratodon purpureus]|uniref:Uncharacterized protein n=2 Tax=Ceratodon purpureus TaxID=3225 RepID=A0A8T0JCD0_CERPU|nr:hypothetical protein KC19_1G245500 [Ceratodon purpureus]
MGVFKSGPKWFNQKIGNFLGDFEEERPLKEEPEPYNCRAFFRVMLVLVLIAGAALAFVLLFRAAPNVRVVRIYLQNDNTDYATQRMFNSSVAYGGDIDEQQKLADAAVKNLSDQFGVVTNYTSASDPNKVGETEVLVCPCTTTTVSWTEYVHFYSLNYTPPQPLLNYTEFELPPPQGTVLSLITTSNFTSGDVRYLTKESNLTHERFCDQLHMIPSRFLPTSFFMDCPALVAALLTTEPQGENLRTNWNDPRTSYFESPVLLNQKFLYANTLRRLNAYQREQFTLLSAIQPYDQENTTHRNMFLTGMTDIWLLALDRFAANSSSTDLDFFLNAADRTSGRYFERVHFFSDYFAVIMNEGNTFLGVEVNWPQYYNVCRPSYCDVTKQSTALYRSYTVLAVLGGLANLAILPAQLFVWPVIAFALLGCFKTFGGNTKKKSTVKPAKVASVV